MGQQTTITMHDKIGLDACIHEKGNPSWIIATHGIGESYRRHSWPIELFGQDFNIAQYDLRGHGKSDGPPGYGKFELFKRDLGSLLLHLKQEYKMKKYILFGHSMGALICADWLQNCTPKGFHPQAVFLNAPPVGFTGIPGKIFQHTPLATLSKINDIPLSFKIGGLIDTGRLSHDPRVKKQYHADPLNHLKLHSKLLLEMVMASRRTFSRPINPQCPAFVTVGSEDTIICVNTLLNYFKSVEKSFHLQVFEGAWHELHNETKKYRLPYFEFLQNSLHDLLQEN